MTDERVQHGSFKATIGALYGFAITSATKRPAHITGVGRIRRSSQQTQSPWLRLAGVAISYIWMARTPVAGQPPALSLVKRTVLGSTRRLVEATCVSQSQAVLETFV
jgi:hypothetical protein